MEWGSLGKHILLSSMLSLLVFVMLNVAVAQIISSTLLEAADGNTALTAIIFIGFLVALIVALIVNISVSEEIPKLRVFYASVFAFGANVLAWVIIAYYSIMHAYPDLFADPETGSLFNDVIARGWVYVVAIPRVLAYYAIYVVGDITRFWIYTLLLYTVLYAVFLYDLAKVQGKL